MSWIEKNPIIPSKHAHNLWIFLMKYKYNSTRVEVYVWIVFLCVQTSSISPVFIFLFFIETRVSFWLCLSVHCSYQQNKRRIVHTSGSYALFTGPTNLFFQQLFFINNGSYDTIRIFKIYFIIMFLIFNKINGIKIDPKSILFS